MPRVHTIEEVTNAILQGRDGPLASYYWIISTYNLAYDHHNDEYIFLQAQAAQDEYQIAKLTRYWYRSMTPQEFDHLNRKNRFYGSSYGGIAPYRQYVKDPRFFGNNSSNTHIIEFATPIMGFLHERFSRHKAKWGDIKSEGGGTYGLGPTGNGGGAAGADFNKLLALRQISWEVVNLKIPNPLID